MGIITTGNPLTTSITKTVSTGMKQQDRHTVRCHLPKTKWGGEKSSSCQSQGGPVAPALLALSLNTHFPEAFPDYPASQELSTPPLNSHHTSSPPHDPLIHFSLLCRTFLASS